MYIKKKTDPLHVFRSLEQDCSLFKKLKYTDSSFKSVIISAKELREFLKHNLANVGKLTTSCSQSKSIHI